MISRRDAEAQGLKRKTENDILCVLASLREKYHITSEAA
jgi:hypothetical protein